MVTALSIALLLHQAEALDAGTIGPSPLDEARVAIEAMRETLRAVEHGLQEASALGDSRAFDCVTTGHLALTHQVESAEQSQILLEEAVAADDPALTARLLKRILEAQREIHRRAAELSTCRLSVEPPRPVMNRTWFGCRDAPPSLDNPAWRGCERRRTSAVTFGLGGLLVAAPVASLVAASQRGVDAAGFGGLALESAAGGLIGGVALFALSGAAALAISGGLAPESSGRVATAVGVSTALGVGAGAVLGMWLDRPQSGAAAIVAAAAGYVVVAAISAVLIAVHDHFTVASSPDDEPTLAEQTFSVAPALMVISGMLTVPAMWSIFSAR